MGCGPCGGVWRCVCSVGWCVDEMGMMGVVESEESESSIIKCSKVINCLEMDYDMYCIKHDYRL